MAHSNLFGKPGHGAPTNDIRKKKFTEYQLQSHSTHPHDLGDAVANPVDFVPTSALPNNPYKPPSAAQMADEPTYQPRPNYGNGNPYHVNGGGHPGINGHNGPGHPNGTIDPVCHDKNYKRS